MNNILGEIGWGAVCVDGFIPPTAFMEFQAYKVLVIAADIRQLEHIEYTPAPELFMKRLDMHQLFPIQSMQSI